jgi:hypothetical protein
MPARIGAMYIPDATASSDVQTVIVESPAAAPAATRSRGGQK